MGPILLGKGINDDVAVQLVPALGNRDGLVADATGKIVTLMTVAEGFSRIGVPVFMADAEGNVAEISLAGEGSEKPLQRAQLIGLADHGPAANPAVPWDLCGKKGHPVRAMISETGSIAIGVKTWSKAWPGRRPARSAPGWADKSFAAYWAAWSTPNPERRGLP